ncbi:hypothetical protein MLD38_008808 [Melastoma candidum]|uniref:Uncharacterized protein n=1 Tax=Melastoma candidum TaxID=119954 RepID=A0ACB9RYL1_9MYRT|nr:hypothetical protein MLD38_008808 [Melastoma candidum]
MPARSSNFNILSRSYVEFLILGTDNLPRTILLYMANTPLFPCYFMTVLCNSQQFNKTVINHNSVYTQCPSNLKSTHLSSSDSDDMTRRGAAFASPFSTCESIFDRIDSEIVGRMAGQVSPGGWCLGGSGNDNCSIWGDADILRPGPGTRKLEKLLANLLSNSPSLSQQCITIE